MRILTVTVVMFAICACDASHNNKTDHHAKEMLVKFVKSALTDFFAFHDKFLQLLRQPKPEGLRAAVDSMGEQNKIIEEVIMKLFNNKDEFMNSGRFDKFVELKRLRPVLEQALNILKSLQKEALLMHLDSGTHKGINPFVQVKDRLNSLKNIELLKDIINIYQIILVAVRNFVLLNEDVFDIDQVAEFMKQTIQVTHAVMRLKQEFDNLKTKKYAFQPLLESLLKRVGYLYSNLHNAIRTIYRVTMNFSNHETVVAKLLEFKTKQLNQTSTKKR